MGTPSPEWQEEVPTTVQLGPSVYLLLTVGGIQKTSQVTHVRSGCQGPPIPAPGESPGALERSLSRLCPAFSYILFLEMTSRSWTEECPSGRPKDINQTTTETNPVEKHLLGPFSHFYRLSECLEKSCSVGLHVQLSSWTFLTLWVPGSWAPRAGQLPAGLVSWGEKVPPTWLQAAPWRFLTPEHSTPHCLNSPSFLSAPFPLEKFFGFRAKYQETRNNS